MSLNHSGLSSTGFRRELAAQEFANGLANFLVVGFQSEVPRLEEAHDRTGNITLERLGAGRQKERVILAPRRQKRRLVLAEVLLE